MFPTEDIEMDWTRKELRSRLTDNFNTLEVYGSIFGNSIPFPYSDDKECIVILDKLKN